MLAVLPDIKSTGVLGDERIYTCSVILCAVESSDAMTSDYARLLYHVQSKISGSVVAESPGVNRVVYGITPKPLATIEWEQQNQIHFRLKPQQAQRFNYFGGGYFLNETKHLNNAHVNRSL